MSPPFFGFCGTRLILLPTPFVLVQARTHRKRRINKKWRKRYGMRRVPDPSVNLMEIFSVGQTSYAYRPAYDAIMKATRMATGSKL